MTERAARFQGGSQGAGPAVERRVSVIGTPLSRLPDSCVVGGGQMSLFGRDEPAIDETFARIERVSLGDGAWLELARGWLGGDALLFECMRSGLRWRAESRTMYEREVFVPRLHAVLDEGALPPIIERMRRALGARYEMPLPRTSAAFYRDGKDSVAWHGDYVARRMEADTVVATVSLGAPRTFLVRRRGGGSSRAWSLGNGDLCVMGGSCQRTHEHAIPKVASAAPRIALMFRPIWKRADAQARALG